MFKFLWYYVRILLHIPMLLLRFCLDLVDYVKYKLYLNFNLWGLHLWVGRFGSGKTIAMVNRAYRLCKRYKNVSVITNLTLNNFPSWTKIMPLTSPQDILDAPSDCIVLIDEIGTIFNSRDFAAKNAIPKILFQHLCQCRKRRMVIFATTQCWNFLDKQLRDICDTVRVCHSWVYHPFTRLTAVKIFDARQYDVQYTNPVFSIPLLGWQIFIQTDAIRNRYDTSQLIDGLLKKEYLSDQEILINRGEIDSTLLDVSGSSQRRAKRHTR